MGFRTGAYAKVWEVTPKTPGVTQLKLSVSTKNRESNEYVTEISESCSAIGSTAATAAKALKPGDRIKLGDVDVKSVWVKKVDGKSVVVPKYEEGARKFYNFFVYSFEKADQRVPAPADDYDPTDVPDADEDEGLPF